MTHYANIYIYTHDICKTNLVHNAYFRELGSMSPITKLNPSWAKKRHHCSAPRRSPTSSSTLHLKSSLGPGLGHEVSRSYQKNTWRIRRWICVYVCMYVCIYLYIWEDLINVFQFWGNQFPTRWEIMFVVRPQSLNKCGHGMVARRCRHKVGPKFVCKVAEQNWPQTSNYVLL